MEVGLARGIQDGAGNPETSGWRDGSVLGFGRWESVGTELGRAAVLRCRKRKSRGGAVESGVGSPGASGAEGGAGVAFGYREKRPGLLEMESGAGSSRDGGMADVWSTPPSRSAGKVVVAPPITVNAGHHHSGYPLAGAGNAHEQDHRDGHPDNDDKPLEEVEAVWDGPRLGPSLQCSQERERGGGEGRWGQSQCPLFPSPSSFWVGEDGGLWRKIFVLSLRSVAEQTV